MRTASTARTTLRSCRCSRSASGPPRAEGLHKPSSVQQLLAYVDHKTLHMLCWLVQAQHADLAPGTAEPSGAVVSVAGRLTAKRVMGKLAFLGLRDDKGQIQVMMSQGLHAGL